MSAGLFYELKNKARTPYSKAICETMLAFFQASTSTERAEILWTFAKEHGHEPGHDIRRWSKLIRFVEQAPVLGGPRQRPNPIAEAE